jgi:site-specific DNA-methyltransferase (adenine-specific)
VKTCSTAQSDATTGTSGGDGWTLHLGDCLQGLRELADDSVDVAITDPPYEAEAHTKGKRQGPTYDRRVRVVDAEFDFAPITEAQRTEVGRHLGRVSRRLAVVFCQVEAAMLWRTALEAGGLTYRRTIPWVKPDAMPSLHGRWPGQAFEAIVLAVRPSKRAPIGGKSVYYEHTRERGDARAHPTAKPLSLMLDLVRDFSDPNELVLDPFAGSGTTGVACRMLGRRFLGWELNPEYHAIATRRLSGDEAKPRPEQPSLFDAVRP